MRLLREGQIIRNTYEVERYLGEGAFAEVWRVKHRFLGRQAMKVFKLPGLGLEETHQMLGEAMMLSRIGHPNIVRVFDADLVTTSQGECPFFTMEHVAGGSLEAFWKSYGMSFVPMESAVEIIRQVCRGLAVSHSENPPIVHRDVKPQNILVGYDGGGLRVRLSDFGLAKRANPLTLLVSAQGTMRFKAPEVFIDSQSDSCAGDVWAVGCTLYLLLTDRLPYADTPGGGGGGGVNVFFGPLRPPGEFNHRVDKVLEEITMRALSIKPQSRYPTAQHMLADLEKWKPAPPPAASGAAKQAFLSDMTKTALGPQSSLHEAEARRLVAQAMRQARLPAKLMEAADLLEEALGKCPDLREHYEYQVRLWRRGVVM